MEYYSKKCGCCNSETPHQIANMNFKKGVKLKCISCNCITNKWIKVNELKEWEITK